MLDVSGMMCGGCSASVKNILLKQPGVQGAAVNLITHAAAVTVRWARQLRRNLTHRHSSWECDLFRSWDLSKPAAAPTSSSSRGRQSKAKQGHA